jgi:nitroimidazol reductase NimA-like FMN-containing flavoprotein (pyridoxamine 5'-phosphate oxidase superfamily)
VGFSVWYAASEHRKFFWVSKPQARHSRNIATRPRVAVVIFDSHQPGGWQAVYMSAEAEEVGDPGIDEGIVVFTRRSEEQGLGTWTGERVRPPARHRLYMATANEQFVLDPRDERHPVTLD